MGWSNPPVPWSELEKRLSDVSRPGSAPPVGADGGDSPAWSYKRKAYQAPPDAAARPEAGVVPYAELHAHSSFSFLDGASMPEHLAEEATRLGLHALALTDHDGFYGIARMAEAAAELHGLATVFGAELSLVRRTASPIRRALICSYSPAGRRATTASPRPSPRRI
jgi:error-prone DNA polymerase